MKLAQILAFCFGCIITLLSIGIYVLHHQWLGFPDGHLTELQSMEKSIGSVLIGISSIVSVYCFYLAWQGSKKIISGKLGLAAILYTLVVLIFTAGHSYFATYLDNGAGG